MKRITDKQRIDWIEKESKKRVISFYHPIVGFPHVRAAIDDKIRQAQASAKSKPKPK